MLSADNTNRLPGESASKVQYTAEIQPPLARFLPPLPEGCLRPWLDDLPKGKIILDPFGASPALVAEIAAHGYTVITAANNPITQLLIETSAYPPRPEESRQVLSFIAAERVRKTRVESYIKSLYQTECPNCNQVIEANSFIWDRDASSPHTRAISCPFCDCEGEFPTCTKDSELATRFLNEGLHYARALERVAQINDPDRHFVEETLSIYPPRAIHIVQTIINQLDSLKLNKRQRRVLDIMLLEVFDHANTLWPHPQKRERPRQQTIPPQYKEHNLWRVLEAACDSQPLDANNTPAITYWPNLPLDKGGVCIITGRIKEFVSALKDVPICAVITAFPRPNQAFWSLSALWSGWLWGAAVASEFRVGLRRRRYDWNWHTNAIHDALSSLTPILSKGTPLVGLITESEPGYISAVSIACSTSGFALNGMRLDDNGVSTSSWKVPESTAGKTPRPLTSAVIIDAAKCFLGASGEPVRYLKLHTAICRWLIKTNSWSSQGNASDIYAQFTKVLQKSLTRDDIFLRFSGSDQSLDVGFWWLQNEDKVATPLADRTEVAVVNQLIRTPGASFEEINKYVQQSFPDLLPSSDLIYMCLDSYGEYDGTGWRLKESDRPTIRREDILQISQLLENIGSRLSFSVTFPESEDAICLWGDGGIIRYSFFISASGLLGKYFADSNHETERAIIVIPGGRSKLVRYKLSNDPRLKSIEEERCQFIKFRQIRQLAKSTTLNRENFEENLGLDPLTYTETQLRLF